MESHGVTMIIVMLGAPGAGKGTQSKVLQDELNLVHISSGDLLRDNIRRGTALGKTADDYITKGELVPDKLMIDMIADRLAEPDAEHGVLLDGFPRTLPQAAALDDALDLMHKRVNAALYINVEDGVLIDRLSSRLTCRAKGHVFNLKFHKPQVEGICDYDGSELYQRPDDTPETAQKRLEVYFDQTRPIIGYYRDKGILCEVNGHQYRETVTWELLNCLR